jgi:hypothetical protein
MIVFLFLGAGIFFSCNKNGFLDKKPNSDNVIPSSLDDFQALLDNPGVMSVTPALGELSADNYQLDYVSWQGLDVKEHNAHAWQADIYDRQGNVADWNLPYQQVFYANTVLDGLSKLKTDSTGNNPTWMALKGAALFIRAYAFYNVVQLFAPAYDSLTAGNDMGIPLRLSPEIGSKSVRASVQASYAQILGDLDKAEGLLPVKIPLDHPNRPSRPAVLALLARVYLSMRAYGQAGLYADNCVQAGGQLLDYNTLSTGGYFSFPASNIEIIYPSNFFTTPPQIMVGVIYPSVVVDSALFNSYDTNDLRRKMYFKSSGTNPPIYKASYNASILPFSGLATDEILLIRAECRARAGQTAAALGDLNSLLSKRWVTGTFSPVTAGSPGEALDSILVERRKELPFRGLRWMDLKRLNKGGANITLTRKLSGVSPLLPNSNLYVLPIPPDVLSQVPDMKDNPRP